MFADLVRQGIRTIAFARTRKAAELIYRYAADRLGVDGARKISPYRAGYTPKERRDIEQRLFRGELLGVVSTNALELGVDVGSLDAVVCCGYPGSVASIWQQWGRAGRGTDPALAVYIAGRDSLDQYLFENPNRVLGTPGRGRPGDDGEPVHPRTAPARRRPRSPAGRRGRRILRPGVPIRGEADDGGPGARGERRAARVRRRR